MANTIMSAKNSFQSGLIMDLSPDNTQATCMTSALNATLLTLNGNELSLLNDMGNGRVETAYLPEGYIPVGTCEFGDIIYIVSYNPIDNKALIGCFPSPERNISSNEIGVTLLSLSSSDFVDNNHNIINTSVKKILIDKKINPGDKYIIYSTFTEETGPITENREHLTDYINDESDLGKPKIVKLHVVSIEDSGKITYLDTTTKWYDNYYIKETKVDNEEEIPDIDSLRDLISSNWSIFNTKTSGKLAILAELETIDSFSCSYHITKVENIKEEDSKTFYKYNVTLEPTYTAEEGISPKYLIILNMNNPTLLDTSTLSDVLNSTNKDINPENYAFEWEEYEKPTEQNPNYKGVTMTFKIPYVVDELGNRKLSKDNIVTFDVVPGMSFGKLESMKATISIDFNKIGTGEITLDTWKYHNSASAITLLYGLSMYLLPNETIDYVTIELYDNQGKVGEYFIDDRKSYNGVITEYLGLDGSNINKNFSKYEKTINDEKESLKYVSTIIEHKGLEAEINEDEYNNYKEQLKKDGLTDDYLELAVKDKYLKITEGNGKIKYYQNDAGTLYSNFLYLAVLSVKKNTESKPICIGLRWLWTNNMFNEYYYKIDDFKELKPILTLDNQAVFEANPLNYLWKETLIDNLGKDINEGRYNSYSANILHIGYDDIKENLNMYIYPGLLNDYGCFSLSEDSLDDFKVVVKLDLGLIERSFSGYTFSLKDSNVSEVGYLSVENIVLETTDALNNNDYITLSKPINDKDISIKDEFKVSISENTLELKNNKQEKVWDLQDNILTGSLEYCFITPNKIKKQNKPILLLLQASIINKAYTEEEVTVNIEMPVYEPIINSMDDLANLGIRHADISNLGNYSKKLGLDAILINCNEEKDYLLGGYMKADGTKLHYTEIENYDIQYLITPARGKDFDARTNNQFIEKVWNTNSVNLKTFFNIYQFGLSNTDYIGAKNSDGTGIPLKEFWKDYVRSSFTYNHFRPTTVSENDWGNYPMARLPNDDIWPLIESGKTNMYWLYSQCLVTMLGIRWGDGMALFNLAYGDTSPNDGTYIEQEHSRTLPYNSATTFPNFAYQLYLLLSRVYHKNKTGEPKQQNAKNHVKPEDHSTSIIKSIITEISPKISVEKHDVIFHGVSFNDYITEVLDKVETILKNKIGETFIKDDLLDTSSSVKFVGTAKENILNITIENSSVEFLDMSKASMFIYAGEEHACNEITDNKFYLYYNGELKPYEDKTLIFSEEDILDLNQYIFENRIPLYGITPKRVANKETEELKKAAKKLVEFLKSYSEYWSSRYYYNNDTYYLDDRYYEVMDNAIGFGHDPELNLIYDMAVRGHIRLVRYVEGQQYPKYLDITISKLSNAENIILVLSEGNVLYDIISVYHPLYGNYSSDISLMNLDTYDFLKKNYDNQILFTPNLKMSDNFKYDSNGLVINTNRNHGEFGVCQDSLTYGGTFSPKNTRRGIYGGMRDMSIDTNYEFISY